MTEKLLPHDIEMALLLLPPLDAKLAATLKDKQSLVISALMASSNILSITDYYYLSTAFKETTNLSEMDPRAWLFHGSDIRDDGGRAANVQQSNLGGKRNRRISKWECDVYQRQAQMCVDCTDGWRKRLRQILIQFYGRKHSCLVVVEKMHGKHFALLNNGDGIAAHVFEPDKEARMPVSIGTMPCDLDCLPVLMIASEVWWMIEEDMECIEEEEEEEDIVHSTQLDLYTVVSPAAFCIHAAV